MKKQINRYMTESEERIVNRVLHREISENPHMFNELCEVSNDGYQISFVIRGTVSWGLQWAKQEDDAMLKELLEKTHQTV